MDSAAQTWHTGGSLIPMKLSFRGQEAVSGLGLVFP